MRSQTRRGLRLATFPSAHKQGFRKGEGIDVEDYPLTGCIG